MVEIVIHNYISNKNEDIALSLHRCFEIRQQDILVTQNRTSLKGHRRISLWVLLFAWGFTCLSTFLVRDGSTTIVCGTTFTLCHSQYLLYTVLPPCVYYYTSICICHLCHCEQNQFQMWQLFHSAFFQHLRGKMWEM